MNVSSRFEDGISSLWMVVSPVGTIVLRGRFEEEDVLVFGGCRCGCIGANNILTSHNRMDILLLLLLI